MFSQNVKKSFMGNWNRIKWNQVMKVSVGYPDTQHSFRWECCSWMTGHPMYIWICFLLQHFIAHPCAQSVIKKIWLGSLRASNLYIILAILFPLLIFRLKFADLTTQGQTKPGRLRKLHLFYTSPVTRFWTFVVSTKFVNIDQSSSNSQNTT